jgi:hypothetical protein
MKKADLTQEVFALGKIGAKFELTWPQLPDFVTRHLPNFGCSF